MSKKINKASCEMSRADSFERGITRKPILQGEIKGLETFYVELAGGNVVDYLPEDHKLKVFLFTSGTGNISHDELIIPVQELALFIPDMHWEFSIEGGKGNLKYLEIAMWLEPNDLKILDKQQDRWPYYVAYSECKKYNESIKSEKTISRMILPEDIVPRLCIGSVETSGPDEVAAHSHPMLEQLFFGLPGNECIVSADNAKIRLLGNDLLHIPLGSMHGVSVESAKDLHYIWIDLFHSQEDMNYIKDSHIIIDE